MISSGKGCSFWPLLGLGWLINNVEIDFKNLQWSEEVHDYSPLSTPEMHGPLFSWRSGTACEDEDRFRFAVQGLDELTRALFKEIRVAIRFTCWWDVAHRDDSSRCKARGPYLYQKSRGEKKRVFKRFWICAYNNQYTSLVVLVLCISQIVQVLAGHKSPFNVSPFTRWIALVDPTISFMDLVLRTVSAKFSYFQAILDTWPWILDVGH